MIFTENSRHQNQAVVDIEYWTKLAASICQDVYDKEYYGLLGIPKPKILHLDPAHEHYSSGQYYITIGDGWQIHLNLGKLPLSEEEFEREFRVVLRHEIEHFRTCPFDLLTHLRMMKTALKICRNRELAAEIVNQVSDIIVDTNNFIRYPKDTLWSEKIWIQNTSLPYQKSAPSSLFMFLVKQGLWEKKLMRYITIEEDLKKKIEETVAVFQEGGITNTAKLTQKVVHYARLQTQLLQDEGKISSAPITLKGMSDGRPKTGEMLNNNDEAVRNAIQSLAQETNLDDFSEILDGSGFGFTKREMQQIWYEQNCSHTFELPFKVPKKGEAHIAYPVNWRISDPPENLDMLLSLQTSPIIIPNITTKKWLKHESPISENIKDKPDLLLMMDSSASMNWEPTNPESPYHIGLLASFSLLEYYEKSNGTTAGIIFSNSDRHIGWTSDYQRLKKLYLDYMGGTTNFPIETVRNLMGTGRQRILVILTDDELNNWQECQNLFLDLLYQKHKVLLFLIRKQKVDQTQYESFISNGGRLYVMQKAEDVYAAVIDDA